MGEIMNPSKGVKSGVPERVSISCLTCDTVTIHLGTHSCISVSHVDTYVDIMPFCRHNEFNNELIMST